jgi:hypothetical protein
LQFFELKKAGGQRYSLIVALLIMAAHTGQIILPTSRLFRKNLTFNQRKPAKKTSTAANLTGH